MAFKCTPESFRDELNGSLQLRKRVLQEKNRLLQRYTGRFYRSDKRPERAVTVNLGYEYMAVTLPGLVYDSPRVRIRSGNKDVVASVPDADGNIWTMGAMARGIEIGLNRWSEDSEIGQPLLRAAYDFLFTWSVVLVTSQDRPGFQGDELVPRSPYLVNIQNEHFALDATARSCDPMGTGGPRWMAHWWRADKEDLLADDQYDHDVVEKLMTDDNTDEYDPVREDGGVEAPDRDEILCWDFWVPEKNVTSEPGYNGSIYTLAIKNGPDGTGQASEFIRKEVPAFCPPWGPYVMFGAHQVPGEPYPMGPLTAVAEQWESANNHATQMSEDSRTYKRFTYSDKRNPADMLAIKNVVHGQHVQFQDAEKIGQLETGGSSQYQAEYTQIELDRAYRTLGISESVAGDPESGVTATAEAASMAGRDARMAGLKQSYRKSVDRVMKSAAWQMFYDEAQVHDLGDDGRKYGMEKFWGGVEEWQGRQDFNFYDLSLSIDPMSMEHTDQAVHQRRVTTAIETMSSMATIMASTPYINWREPWRALFESINVGDADEWFDFQQLAMAQQMQMQQQVAPQDAPATPSVGQAKPSGTPVSPTIRPHVSFGRETGQTVPSGY